MSGKRVKKRQEKKGLVFNSNCNIICVSVVCLNLSLKVEMKHFWFFFEHRGYES